MYVCSAFRFPIFRKGNVSQDHDQDVDVLRVGADESDSLCDGYPTCSFYRKPLCVIGMVRCKTRKRKIPQENVSREIATVNKVRHVLIAIYNPKRPSCTLCEGQGRGSAPSICARMKYRIARVLQV